MVLADMNKAASLETWRRGLLHQHRPEEAPRYTSRWLRERDSL